MYKNKLENDCLAMKEPSCPYNRDFQQLHSEDLKKTLKHARRANTPAAAVHTLTGVNKKVCDTAAEFVWQ